MLLFTLYRSTGVAYTGFQMAPVQQILDSFLAKQENWRITLLQKWDTIVGGLKTRIRLEKIYEDTLIIGVYEAHWMHELFMLSRDITSMINNALDKPRITQIRFKLVEEKKRTKYAKKNQVPKTNIPPAPLMLSLEQHAALSKINDMQLQQALKSFLERCQLNATL